MKIVYFLNLYSVNTLSLIISWIISFYLNGLLTFYRHLLLKVNGCGHQWIVIAPEFTYAAYMIFVFHCNSNKAEIINDNPVGQQTEVTYWAVCACLPETNSGKEGCSHKDTLLNCNLNILISLYSLDFVLHLYVIHSVVIFYLFGLVDIIHLCTQNVL